MTGAYDEVYRFFDVLQKGGHTVLGYTIMPNHVHFLLFFNKQTQSLNTVIGNGKRFIGYEIIKRLQRQNATEVLPLLQQGVVDAEKRRDKKHQIWQGAFDVKECYREKFILQKLNYMHYNPCVERWKLCTQPSEYDHSSALFYEMGEQGKFAVRGYRDFLAVLLDLEEMERARLPMRPAMPMHKSQQAETHRERKWKGLRLLMRPAMPMHKSQEAETHRERKWKGLECRCVQPWQCTKARRLRHIGKGRKEDGFVSCLAARPRDFLKEVITLPMNYEKPVPLSDFSFAGGLK